MSSTAHDYRIEIQKLHDLPPLPVVANELMATLNDPDADIDDIAEIIGRDPGLTAKLLSLANSAFFGFGRNVSTIAEAIINVLGLELVKSLSIGLIMSGTFDPKKCSRFDIGQYWIGALLTAEMVKRLNKVKTVDDKVKPGFYYLYGLLHNLGILVMADCFPQEMDAVFAEKEQHPERRLTDIEQQHMGIDHHNAALFLASRWSLPEDITTVMAHYFENDYQGDYWQICRLTGYCSALTRSWYSDDEIEQTNVSIRKLFDFDADKMEKEIEVVHQKMDDVSALASQMNS